MKLKTCSLNGFDGIGYWYFCEYCEITLFSEITKAADFVHNTEEERRKSLREKM